MPPRVDYLTVDEVMELAKNEKSRQVQVCSQPQGKNPAQTNLIRKNWITCFLNRHPELALKFSSRTDRQRHYSSPLSRAQEVIRENDIKENRITNVDEKGFIIGI